MCCPHKNFLVASFFGNHVLRVFHDLFADLNSHIFTLKNRKVLRIGFEVVFFNLFFGRFLYFRDFKGNKEFVFNFKWIWVFFEKSLPLWVPGVVQISTYGVWMAFPGASMQNCVTAKGDVIECLVNQQVFVLRNKALNFIFWSNNFFNTTLSCTVSLTSSLDWTTSLAAQISCVKLHNICVFKYPNEARALIVMIWFFVSGASSQVRSLHPLLLTFHFKASAFEKSTKLVHFKKFNSSETGFQMVLKI